MAMGVGAAPRWQRWCDLALWCLVVLVCIVRIVPFSPDMPLGGLDGSWRYALEQGMADGLVLGQDLVFTFGPYASVYTRSYHPATHSLMMLASLYLALAYAFTLGLFIGPRGRGWLCGLLVVIAGLVFFVDALYFMLPLLVGLQVLRRWPASGAGARGWLLVALVAPLGLLPLVKGTLLVLCAAVALLCAAYLWLVRRRLLACLCLVTPCAVLLVAWAMSGQPMAALGGFFSGMLEIVSGYNEAMAYYGVLRESLLFVIALFVLMWALARLPGLAPAEKGFLFLLYAVVMFINFKAGFVRQDVHAVIASTTLLMAGLALNTVLPNRRVTLATLLIMLPWLIIDHHYNDTTPAKLVANISRDFGLAWDGATRRWHQPDWPRQQFEAVRAGLRQQAGLPLLAGRSDIYSYNQSLLIASGNQWSPRPVPQSYSAYTPRLAALNRDHLLGAGAPEHIFFSVETIDDRVPALDDGPSWPVLLRDYRPSGQQAGMLILQQQRRGAVAAAPAPLPASTHRLGEVVALPADTALLFAQVEIEPSLLGRMVALLFRTSQLRLGVTLADGRQLDYRLVGAMARAGFVLTPLVENTADFAHLYSDFPALRGKRVHSMTLHTAPGFAWLWRDQYRLTYTPLALPQAGAR